MSRAPFQHAFWLYGVIVGLGITQSLSYAIPRIFAPAEFTLPPDQAEVAMRLFVFLIVIVRFYLGSAVFFNEAYGEADAAEKYKKKSFGLDFLFGFIHFVFFFVWANALLLTTESPDLFLILLLVVLLYDLFWFFACRENDTWELMKFWTFVNVLTALVVVVIYLGLRFVGLSRGTAEYVAYVFVVFVSVVDLMEIVRAEPLMKKWFNRIIN